MRGSNPFRPLAETVGMPGFFNYAPDEKDYLRVAIKEDLERRGPAGRCRRCPNPCKVRAGVRAQILCRRDFEAWAEAHGREPTPKDLQSLLNGVKGHAPRAD